MPQNALLARLHRVRGTAVLSPVFALPISRPQLDPVGDYGANERVSVEPVHSEGGAFSLAAGEGAPASQERRGAGCCVT